jgi:hypothetical protein
LAEFKDSPRTQAESGTEAPPRKGRGGVRTPEGKRVSRANALKDSLRSKVVYTPEIAAAIVELTKIFTEQHRPRTAYERMLISDMAVAKAKLDHTRKLGVLDHERRIIRALYFWDADHDARALALSKNLARDPEHTAHALGWTYAGAKLMVSYWEGLAVALRKNGDWDEVQRRLAYDRLRVRVELRPGSDRVPASGDTVALAALAQQEIEELEDRIADVLEPKHRADQGMVASGLALDEDTTTRKLRRYESGFKSDFNKAEALFFKSRAESEAAAQEAADAFADNPPKTSDAGYDYLCRNSRNTGRCPL